MKTISKIMITGLMLLFAAALSAQTINVSLTITNVDDPLYTATFYVYNSNTSSFCPITSTNPITVENGTTFIPLECKVPIDTINKIYKVGVVVTYSGNSGQDATAFLNTEELYTADAHPLTVNF